MVWSLAALLLFWAIGAYNRLVRLRAQAIAAFAPLEQAMAGLPALLEANFSQPVAEATAPDLVSVELMAAGKRFADALRLARATPLAVAAVDELAKAYQDLGGNLAKVSALPDDLSTPNIAAALQANWDQMALLVQVARADFNRRVQLYNDAIGQFPALLVASAAGLKPGQILS
jgi:LemA protein